MINPQTIIVLGRSGSGKGTQIDLLKENLGGSCLHISTGNLFRALAETGTYTGRKIKEVIEKGGLPDEWLAEFLWQREIIEKIKGDEHIIFDGTPRRLPEAEEMNMVLAWLGRQAQAVLVDITEAEARARLLKRARADDSESSIRKRLEWFNTEVQPVIDYFDKLGWLRRVDGMGQVPEIFERIKKALNLE